MAEDSRSRNNMDQLLDPNSIPFRIIFGHLDLSNQLKLRLIVGKNNQAELTRLLRPTLSVLYVLPTKTSLRNFLLIGKSKYFSEHVRTVIFVPRFLGHDEDPFEEAWAASEANDEVDDSGSTAVEVYRSIARRDWTRKIELSATEARLSYALFRSLLEEHRIDYEPISGYYGDEDADFPDVLYEALEGGKLVASTLTT